jgi:hypothetical protein
VSREALWAGGLVLLAFLHRLAFLFSNVDRSWGFTIFYEGDSETFYNYARAILAGRPYDGGIPFHPPLFPYLLAFVHTLVGAGPGAEQVPQLAIKIVMAALGSLPVGLIFLLVRPYLGFPIALGAAALSLYSFGLYVISIAPVSETLYLILLLGSLLLWSRRLDHPLSPATPHRGSRWIAGTSLGIVLGLLCLTRAEGMLPAAILWSVGAVPIAYRRIRRQPARRFLPWLLVLAGWLIVVTPWTVRNARHLARANEALGSRLAEPLPTFVPLTAYGPLNFALANNAEADGGFSRKVLSSGSNQAVLDLTNPQHLRYFLHGYAIGWSYIRGHPADFVRLVLRKWGIFFEACKLGWTQWDWPGGLDGIRRRVDVFVPYTHAGMWLLLPWILVGLAVCLSQPGLPRRWAIVVLLLSGAGMTTAGLFFGYVRLGILLLPFWFSLAAAAGVGLARLVFRRRFGPKSGVAEAREAAGAGRRGEAVPSLSRRQRWILLGVAAVLLSLEGWGATSNRNFNATGTKLQGQGYLNPHDTMYLEVISGRDESKTPARHGAPPEPAGR